MKTKLRFLTPTHCIIAAFLSLVFAPAADAAWWREYQKMAMYISAETMEAIESPQERAAAQLFQKEFWLDGQFITPSRLDRINAENFDCIWSHIDSNGLGSSAANYKGYNSPEFISAIRKFHQDGGNLSFNNYGTLWIHLDRCGIDRNNPPLSSSEITDALSSFMAQGGSLYLSGHATLLLAKTGRIDSALAPNIFNDGDGGSGTDVWNIQPRIGYFNRESDPSQYYDRSGHTIFADMYTIDTPQGRTIPMEGTGDGSEMWREDHNCMWDLNNLSYTADGRNTVERFERQTNSTVLGQWGHVTDYAVAGLVEFHPQASASRAMHAQGTVIANGLAAYELSPRLGGNSYTANVERLTGNILRYLESKDPRGSMTSVETPETDTSLSAPVFTSSPGTIIYRGVTPGETIYVYTPDGRLAAHSTAIYPDGSISLPLRGTAIVRCGSHAAKILMK